MTDPVTPADVMPAFATLGPYLSIFVASCLPTQVWRWLGVLFAGRVSDTSEVFVWVKAVATALVASVVAKLILSPGGALAELPLALRISAVAFGFAFYLTTGKRLALGILSAEAVLIAGWFILR
ncbi:AzlD domain-containing protein [Acuticoccus sp. I52.16.1]|uniref:AzlD domain-containing protein n=1 Tax=Acuticoccus sp. I52.16.1 TaxID=2928472 RepID=UPI001FD615C1|nr:AzlD domain-containing protein [Acuticoccus sp. I52.16.1]UOM36118.1 AzlD domain-containing protein [Acuticoccus sp. I52.16.1]